MTNKYAARQRLKTDATTRGVRTLVQGLYIDVGVAVAVFMLANIGEADLTNGQAMATLGLSFLKTILTACASYIVRLWGDKSRFPTGPLPPEDPGPPKDEEHAYVEENTGDGSNQPLVDADANVRLIQAQVDLQQAQQARAEQVEGHTAETERRAEVVKEALAAKKRAPRKAPAKRVTPLEEIRQEAKKPVVAKKTPTPRKKPQP